MSDRRMKEVCLEIDNKKVRVRENTTILEAAKTVGIDIPHLCYDPRLKPTGTCRVCIVKIEGHAGFSISCHTPVTEGMKVCTEDEEIAAIRKTILELILSEHRIACTTCEKDGSCKLQEYAYRYQVEEERFGLAKHSDRKPNYTTNSEAILYDPDKCILCGLCVNYCEQVQQVEALTFAGPPGKMEVSTAFGTDLHKSSCVLCGGCVEICPAGAMLDRAATGQGRVRDLSKTRTVCGYCGVGCQIDLNVNPRTNKIVHVTSEVGCIPNNGNLCVKGRFAMDFVSSEKRLTNPLIKRNGKFEEVSWDEAIYFVAKRLDEIRKNHGPDSIAGLSSAYFRNSFGRQ